MHASVGITSLDMWPQFGQVSCEVKIIEVSRVPMSGHQLTCQSRQYNGKYDAQCEAGDSESVEDRADSLQSATRPRCIRIYGTRLPPPLPECKATGGKGRGRKPEDKRLALTQPDELRHRSHESGKSRPQSNRVFIARLPIRGGALSVGSAPPCKPTGRVAGRPSRR
jgi:hypothetical protein